MTPDQNEHAFNRFFATVFESAEFGLGTHEGLATVTVNTAAGTFKFSADQARAVADYIVDLGRKSGDTRCAIVVASLRAQADEADVLEAEHQ